MKYRMASSFGYQSIEPVNTRLARHLRPPASARSSRCRRRSGSRAMRAAAPARPARSRSSSETATVRSALRARLPPRSAASCAIRPRAAPGASARRSIAASRCQITYSTLCSKSTTGRAPARGMFGARDEEVRRRRHRRLPREPIDARLRLERPAPAISTGRPAAARATSGPPPAANASAALLAAAAYGTETTARNAGKRRDRPSGSSPGRASSAA